MEVNPYESPQSAKPLGSPPTTASYSVHCSCGREMPIERSAAGGYVHCDCGQAVKVPRLSELRRRAGQHPYELNTVERIRKMIAEGQLPEETLCQVSLRPTNDVLNITVECETPHTRQYSWWLLLLIGLVSFRALLRASQEEFPAEGREIILDLPLRIAADCQGQVRRMRRAKLRAILCTVPIYARLFQEYPQARIYVR